VRILYLYRPVYPSFRAQHLQIIQTATALAKRGHQVTILANKRTDPNWKTPEVDTLSIKEAPFRNQTMAGMWFRIQFFQWLQGESGWIIARDKRRLLQLHKLIPKRHRIALETHEVDSLLQPDNNWFETEKRILDISHVMLCNCGGTLQLWKQEHNNLPPNYIVHNATGITQYPTYQVSNIIRSFGSHHNYKGANWLAKTMANSSVKLEIYGSWNSSTKAPNNITIYEPVPSTSLKPLIGSSKALLLCLGNDIFGQYLSSPLKLWDYLASPRPIIAPSLASVQEIINRFQSKGVYYYQPNDAESFFQALQEATTAPPRSPNIRTWDDRAAEIEYILSTNQ
jgi:hypothetical protein